MFCKKKELNLHVFFGIVLFSSLLLLSQNSFCQNCTSLCLKTSSGTFFGANLDLMWGDGLIFVNRRGISKQGYLTNTLGKTAKWTSKYGSLTFNLVGREFAWCGINEAGLVISTMSLDSTNLPEEDERPPLVSGFWVQYMLDNCKNVSEVIATDSLVRLAEDKCHFLVADLNGNCASIEFLKGKLIYHTGKELPIAAQTNNPYSELLDYYHKNLIPPSDPFHSVRRFIDVAAKINSFDEQTDTSAIGYLSNILTKEVKMEDTKWSIFFDIEKREVYFQTKDSPKLKSIQLNGFDLSCDAPFKMLDVNVQSSGDVSSKFFNYDHKLNLMMFTKFCERWGVDVSSKNAKALIYFLDGFSCAK
ncbi:MAG: linear amide C-N hydrolase [bacterium]